VKGEYCTTHALSAGSLHRHGSPIATEAVQRIGAIYDIQREVRGKPAEIRTEIRQDAVVR
jgi:hypothetical protein